MQGWREQFFAQDGARLSVLRKGRQTEPWEFACEAEATARRRFVEEAFSWVGTPFRDCADVKGPQGAVDCAMLLVRCAAAAGLIDPTFDPRPYSPRWHVHRGEEKFINILLQLGCREIACDPKPGDVLVWRFGQTYAHGAILANRQEVVHAYGAAGMCIVSRVDEPLLRYIHFRNAQLARPVRYFDIWNRHV